MSSVNPAVTDWATYLVGMAPCLFPPFSRPKTANGGPTEAHRSTLSLVRVTVHKQDAEQLLSTTDPNELAALLRTAWAILLRCYTGQDDVSFGFQHVGDEPTIARFILRDDTSLAEAVARTKTELAGDLTLPSELVHTATSNLSFNTAVAFCDLTKKSASHRVLPSVRHPHSLAAYPFSPLTFITLTLLLLVGANRTACNSNTSSAFSQS